MSTWLHYCNSAVQWVVVFCHRLVYCSLYCAITLLLGLCCCDVGTSCHWLSWTRSRWSVWSMTCRKMREDGPRNDQLMPRYDNAKKNSISTTVLQANGSSKSTYSCFTDLKLWTFCWYICTKTHNKGAKVEILDSVRLNPCW